MITGQPVREDLTGLTGLMGLMSFSVLLESGTTESQSPEI